MWAVRKDDKGFVAIEMAFVSEDNGLHSSCGRAEPLFDGAKDVEFPDQGGGRAFCLERFELFPACSSVVDGGRATVLFLILVWLLSFIWIIAIHKIHRGKGSFS